jgi:hypothetical protein
MRKLMVVPAMLVFAVASTACGRSHPESARAEPPSSTATTTTQATTTSTPSTTTSSSTTMSTSTTSTPTTTLPPLGCGPQFEDQYERRFTLNREFPAPLNDLWQQNVRAYGDNGVKTNVFSGIFLGETLESYSMTSDWQTEATVAAFCFQSVSGEWGVARFVGSITEYLDTYGFMVKTVNVIDMTGLNEALPFGEAIHYGDLVAIVNCDECELTPREVLDDLVSGRQYAFEIIVSDVAPAGSDEELVASWMALVDTNRAIANWLLGQTDVLPDELGTIEGTNWFAPWGQI